MGIALRPLQVSSSATMSPSPFLFMSVVLCFSGLGSSHELLPDFMLGDFAFRPELSPGFDDFLDRTFGADFNVDRRKIAYEAYEKLTEKISQEEKTSKISLDIINDPVVPDTFSDFFLGVPWIESLPSQTFTTTTTVKGARLIKDRQEFGCQRLCDTSEVRDFKDLDGDGFYETMVFTGVQKNSKGEFVPFLRTYKKITGTAVDHLEPSHINLAPNAVDDKCPDISFYDVIKYTTKPKRCCDTSLRQVCTSKSDLICEDVLELKCDVVAWVDCKSVPKTYPGTTCSVDIKDYEFKDCKEVETSTKHTKPVADCKNITKNNCVTDWEVDAQGNKVWTGSETCTPVVWEECEVVEKTVEFPSIETECQTAANIKWTDYADREVDTLGMETTCEVKSATDCKDAQVNKCSHVKWNECKMVPFEECDDVFVYQPDQEKIHKKSCLENNF